MEKLKFSVLMSVYKKENAEYFKQAMDSVINQTLAPEQIVLVRDGEVPELLQQTIDEYLQKYPELFTYVPLEQNGGLGNALNVGLTYCRNELVERMDTDDICTPDRFEKQIAFFKENPEIDIVGGDIAEFSETIDKILDKRVVPKTHEEIFEMLKTRSPLNHITKVGKVLRKLSLDELPQLYCCLIGTMSFIGYRPVVLSEVGLHNMRTALGVHEVRPGVSGYAQVVGRDDVYYKNKAIMDAQYVKDATLWWDLKLVFQTVGVALNRKGNHDANKEREE